MFVSFVEFFADIIETMHLDDAYENDEDIRYSPPLKVVINEAGDKI